MVEQGTQSETDTAWTIHRARLFDRLLTLRERMRLLDSLTMGDKLIIMTPIDKKRAKIDGVFDRFPFLQALDHLAFSAYYDLRGSCTDGAEVGIDILAQHQQAS